MENFLSVYEGMFFEGYESLLLGGQWRLLGIEPLENNEIVSTEDISYDVVLSLYR